MTYKGEDSDRRTTAVQQFGGPIKIEGTRIFLMGQAGGTFFYAKFMSVVGRPTQDLNTVHLWISTTKMPSTKIRFSNGELSRNHQILTTPVTRDTPSCGYTYAITFAAKSLFLPSWLSSTIGHDRHRSETRNTNTKDNHIHNNWDKNNRQKVCGGREGGNNRRVRQTP